MGCHSGTMGNRIYIYGEVLLLCEMAIAVHRLNFLSYIFSGQVKE
jgi:hypothetical protein